MREEFALRGAYFLDEEEKEKVRQKVMVSAAWWLHGSMANVHCAEGQAEAGAPALQGRAGGADCTGRRSRLCTACCSLRSAPTACAPALCRRGMA